MKLICHFIILSVCLCYAQFAHATDPLFADDSVIQIRIEAPMSEIVRKAKETAQPYPATLALEGWGETHAITLAARGKSRRKLGFCRFPPLRVKFQEKPDATSYFKGQKSLKLVTHCNKASKYQQLNYLEYNIYKVYNLLTPQSLKVRLAKIDYVDSEKGKVYASKYGFFIEDMDDAAKRNGMKELDITSLNRSQLDERAAARAGLFNYMIGNLDFSMVKAAPGQDCCHNGKLMAATKNSSHNIVYVPYDFDQTGFVNAPYATPPPSLKVKSVRKRVYRGICQHNQSVKAEAGNFLRNEDRIKQIVSNMTLLESRYKKSTLTYLDDFFAILQDPQQFESKILNACRT